MSSIISFSISEDDTWNLWLINFLESRYWPPLHVDRTQHTAFLFAAFCTGNTWDCTIVTSQNSYRQNKTQGDLNLPWCEATDLMHHLSCFLYSPFWAHQRAECRPCWSLGGLWQSSTVLSKVPHSKPEMSSTPSFSVYSLIIHLNTKSTKFALWNLHPLSIRFHLESAQMHAGIRLTLVLRHVCIT